MTEFKLSKYLEISLEIASGYSFIVRGAFRTLLNIFDKAYLQKQLSAESR